MGHTRVPSNFQLPQPGTVKLHLICSIVFSSLFIPKRRIGFEGIVEEKD